jgi:hypothetical protein
VDRQVCDFRSIILDRHKEPFDLFQILAHGLAIRKWEGGGKVDGSLLRVRVHGRVVDRAC